MKKFIAAALCLIFCVALCAPVSAATDKKAPGESVKVFITYEKSPNTDKYVDCKIEIIDSADGGHETVVDEAASFKIRGNSTSSGEKKPFNIKLSAKTDVLGMGKNKKWCLLANCYEKTLIRNQTVLDFANAIGLRYTPKYRVAEVYLNGKLNGAYLLTDAIQASSSRVDIDTDGHEFVLERDARTDEGTVYFTTKRYGIRLGINEPEEPTDEQYDWLMNFLKEAENTLATGKFADVEKYFDIPSMVDFYIVLEYFKNVDVNTGSTRFYIKDGKIYGGPCWDFDLSSGNCDADYYWDYNNRDTTGDSTEGLICRCLWFRPLFNFAAFKDAVKARYLELQDQITNLYADNRLGQNHIDLLTGRYRETFARNYAEAGWKISKKYSTLEHAPIGSYKGEIEYLRSWLKKRNNWMLNDLGLQSELIQKEDSVLEINGYVISGMREKTRLDDFVRQFENKNITAEKYDGRAIEGKNFVSNGAAVSAGGVTYTVLLRGDPIADGRINATDYAFIKRYFLKTVESDDAYRIAAADVNGNGRIDPADYAMTKRHVLGTFVIGG